MSEWRYQSVSFGRRFSSLARACICRSGWSHRSAPSIPLSSLTGSRLFLRCNPRGLDRRSSLGSSEGIRRYPLAPLVVRSAVLELSEKRPERASFVILGRLQNMLRSRMLVNTALGRGERRALGSLLRAHYPAPAGAGATTARSGRASALLVTG